MPAQLAWALESYRRQDLLLEFASLKHVRLQGIYATLTPACPELWRCVLFVCKGPYAGAVLRFRMSFPEDYPFALPVVTFDPGLFHPLVVADDMLADEDVFTDAPKFVAAGGARLAGSLNLRTGFPGTITSSMVNSNTEQGRINVIEVLLFVRSCFDDSKLLKSLKVHDVVNGDAWKAWLEHGREMDTDDEENTWSKHMSRLMNSSIANEELFDHVVKEMPTLE